LEPRVLFMKLNLNLYFTPKNEYFLSLKNFKTPKGELVSSWVHFISYERIELLLKSQIQITESFDLNKETQKVFKTKNILFKKFNIKINRRLGGWT
jgi:hypothetical protein